MRTPARQSISLVCALILAVALSGTDLAPAVRAQGQVNFGQFNLLDRTSGWVLLGEHLFWTSDVGQTWHEIGPSVPSDASVQDVKFLSTDLGWVLWTTSNLDGSSNFQLAHTIDHGRTWAIQSLSLFDVGDIASYAENAEMDWFDAQTGWISVKQVSGSNFSLGTLFTTTDGGNHWHRLSLPAADHLYFSDLQNGWAIGASNSQLFDTVDAGATWKSITPANTTNNSQTKVYAPFVMDGRGLLVTTTFGTGNDLNVYSLENTDQWLPLGQLKLDVQPGRIGLSFLNPQSFVATIPGTSTIVRMENGKFHLLKNKDGLSTTIVDLDMVSLDRGWAKSVDSSCVTGSSSDRQTASVSCSTTTRLLQTNDGGLTWQMVNLPNTQPGSAALSSDNPLTISTLAASGNTALFTGQGFDACEIPTLSQMQTWSTSSPYKAVNLYIGGSSRACSNNALIASYLFLLKQQGWKFFPTWVGPQAPCTGFSSRMSSDVTTAYNQGVNEANLAVNRLAALGLTGPDKTGSVIYYDIENYGTNATCRDAVNSFMNGWVSQVHARGSTAGVYGSTLCNTGLSDFLTIPNMPDVIWPARWYHNLGKGYYDPTANVWDLGSCLPNSVWANHQRIRQYEGDHTETWGNLAMEIDSDVLDGVVAIPYDYPFVNSINRADLDPTNASSVRFTVLFSKPVTGVDQADFKLTTTGVTNASISSITGSGASYTVTVNTGTGDGTIRLDLADNDTIKDATNNSLGGSGTQNGNFTYGGTYTILKSANVKVEIGGSQMGIYTVPSGGSIMRQYNVTNGPVSVSSLDNTTKLTSERVLNGNGFVNELMGIPNSQLSTEYWFPWYDNVYMQSWIVLGNPSPDTDAHVHIFVAGVEQQGSPYTVKPGDRITPRYTGLVNGPVHILSDINIFASERVHTTQGFVNEVMGVPNNQLTNEYWFPWYDNISMASWVLVGNPDAVNDAHVHIFVAGVEQPGSPYTVKPGDRITPRYTGLVNGPVHILSDINVFTSERVHNATGFINEVMGVPNNQLVTQYWFPWYDNVSTASWILVGNPSTTADAHVHVYIAGEEQANSPYVVSPGSRITPRYFGQVNGPVHIVSDIQVFASERVHTSTQGFVNEAMGIPNNQLTTQYWFPWYDNQSMQSWIVMARP